MSLLLQLFLNGLIAGAIYSLVASGFSLIYSTNKFAHFAHGATIAFSAYMFYALFSLWHIELWASIILSLGLGAALGYVMNFLVYSRLRKQKASALIQLVASVALLILIESLILLFFGADVKTIDLIKVGKGLELFGAIITPLQIFIIIVAVVLLGLLYFFMKHTKLGKAMRAVADNKDVAEIVGISAKKIFAWSFVVGSLIAGVVGILISLEQNLEPLMGTNLMIKGFTGAVVGGIASVPGAILGSFLLGFAENFGVLFLPSGYKDAIAFVLLFVFLLFRPQGLLGIKRSGDREKA